MHPKLAQRAQALAQSEIRNMTMECKKLGGVNLSQGVCDLGVPEAVRQGAENAMKEGINSYTPYDGLPSLRKAIAKSLRRYELDVDPETQITVTVGASGAFAAACLATLDPGDEFILLEPYYGYHLAVLKSLDVTPRFVPLRPPEWSFSMDELESAVTAKTKGIMLCTPANPSGKVFTRTELEAIGDFAQRHDLLVYTDEMYEYFLFDDRAHVPPATIPALKDRTIANSGFSKTFNITGWRIGYTYAPPELAKRIGFFSDQFYVCAPAPLQEGVARGLESLPESYYQDLKRSFSEKRNQLCGVLEDAGLSPWIPQGAYYTLADLSSLPGETSKERAMHLLRETGVACVPGEAFYHRPEDGSAIGRFCFAKKDHELDEACERLAAFAKTRRASVG